MNVKLNLNENINLELLGQAALVEIGNHYLFLTASPETLRRMLNKLYQIFKINFKVTMDENDPNTINILKIIQTEE